MKYFFPVFLILSCGMSLGQTLTWSQTIGDTGRQSLKEIRIDGDGNTVLFGTFDSYPMESGPGRKPFGTIDVFLHKMDPSGKTSWFRNLGSNQVGDMAMAHEMDMDTAGNIFVLCALHSSGPPKVMAALSGDGDTLNLDAEHGGNYVICKYDPDGTLLWARQFEKQDFPVSPIRLMAGHGKVAVYGSFQYRAKILGGTDSLITANDTGFLAEFNGDGRPLSLMIVDSAAQVELLREDDQGNRYMSFSTRYSSRILEKRRPSGEVVWRRRLEKNNMFNQSNLRFVDLVWDSDGNIYLRGDLLGNGVILRLDDGKDTVLAIQDAPSFCVIKLDSSGTMKWVRTGNTGTTGTSKLIMAPDKTLNFLGSSDGRTVKYALDGTVIWDFRVTNKMGQYYTSSAALGKSGSIVYGFSIFTPMTVLGKSFVPSGRQGILLYSFDPATVQASNRASRSRAIAKKHSWWKQFTPDGRLRKHRQ